jgi:hypothetical protein
MNFAQHHYADVLSILAGLALGVSTIGKRWKSARGLLLFRLGALFIFAGGCLGSLHYFQNIDWVHLHHWRIYFVGWTLKNVGLGMLIVIVALGLYKDIEPDEKLSLS